MTLDKLLPADMRDSVIQVPVNIPQGVKDICAELQNEEGIESVFLGRQVEERRVVSQASYRLTHVCPCCLQVHSYIECIRQSVVSCSI